MSINLKHSPERDDSLLSIEVNYSRRDVDLLVHKNLTLIVHIIFLFFISELKIHHVFNVYSFLFFLHSIQRLTT